MNTKYCLIFGDFNLQSWMKIFIDVKSASFLIFVLNKIFWLIYKIY